MRQRSHCADADPTRWLAAGIDLAHAMLSRFPRQPPTPASPSGLRPPPDTVSALPTALPSALGPIAAIQAKPKSP
jgi:hypothetical protein